MVLVIERNDIMTPLVFNRYCHVTQSMNALWIGNKYWNDPHPSKTIGLLEMCEMIHTDASSQTERCNNENRLPRLRNFSANTINLRNETQYCDGYKGIENHEEKS